MKKVIAFALLFFGAIFLATSQETYNQDKFENLTSGKWQIETVTVDNEIMHVADEGHWMVFYENGLYQIILDNEEQVGTWKLNQQNNIQFDFENFEGESNISELSDDELKFSISGYTLALKK